MARKTNSTSAKADTTRSASLGVFASALTAIEWGANDIIDTNKTTLGNELAGLLICDLEQTIEAINKGEADLHLDILEHDCDRWAMDYKRSGLEMEGPGIVILLRFIIGQIQAVAA